MPICKLLDLAKTNLLIWNLGDTLGSAQFASGKTSKIWEKSTMAAARDSNSSKHSGLGEQLASFVEVGKRVANQDVETKQIC